MFPLAPFTVKLFVFTARVPEDASTVNLLVAIARFPDIEEVPVTASEPTDVAPETERASDNDAACVTDSVPAKAVFPVKPSMLNLFVAISRDPSAAVTLNFPLFTLTSLATVNVEPSVTAPERVDAPSTERVPFVAVFPDAAVTINLSVLIF